MDFNITHTIFIERSQDDVFKFVTDFRNDRHWWKPVIRTELMTEGDFGHGSVTRQYAKVMWVTVENQFTVIEYNPPREIRYVNESKQLSYDLMYRFEAVEGGSTFTMVADLTAHGILKPLLPIVIPYLKIEVNRYHKVLKAYLESQNSSKVASVKQNALT